MINIISCFCRGLERAAVFLQPSEPHSDIVSLCPVSINRGQGDDYDEWLSINSVSTKCQVRQQNGNRAVRNNAFPLWGGVTHLMASDLTRCVCVTWSFLLGVDVLKGPEITFYSLLAKKINRSQRVYVCSVSEIEINFVFALPTSCVTLVESSCLCLQLTLLTTISQWVRV